jgi:hypothetical protein
MNHIDHGRSGSIFRVVFGTFMTDVEHVDEILGCD